jgi:hypothetical protein
MSTTFLNYFMYVPRIGSRREKLIEIVNKSGGITIERLVEKHGMLGAADTMFLIRDLKKLAKLYCINQIGDVFFPIYKSVPAVFEVDKNLVPPREPVPFTPLKTFPPTLSPRGQPIERRSFKTCKSSVRYQSKNDI